MSDKAKLAFINRLIDAYWDNYDSELSTANFLTNVISLLIKEDEET